MDRLDGRQQAESAATATRPSGAHPLMYRPEHTVEHPLIGDSRFLYENPAFHGVTSVSIEKQLTVEQGAGVARQGDAVAVRSACRR